MIALYSRVSTSEQAKEGYSIGEQHERLQKYCESRGWKGFKHFTDPGFSGGNMDRPALQDMIAKIKDGTITKVIVYKLDRLSRSQKDTLLLIEDLFIPNHVDFISMSENLDTSSSFGMAMVGMLSCFAQLERQNIKERITLGRNARAKKGMWHGGSCSPIGYDYIDGQLKINDFESLQIRECFNLYQAGHTYTEIANTLNSKGWTHRHGKWSLQRVRSVLINPVYIGCVTFDGQQYEGVHEPIIDKQTFDAVGALIAKNSTSHNYNRRPIHEAYLLGKIWCAKCGKRYTRTISTTGHKKNNPKISYYTCSARIRPKDYKCNNTPHRSDEIDNIVFDSMKELVLSDVIEYRAENKSDSHKSLGKELEKIKKQREKLIELYTMGTFSPNELQSKADELNRKQKAIESQLSDKRSIDEMEYMINSIGDVLNHGDPVMIRSIIDELIDHIEIDGEDVIIYWDFN